MALSKIQAESMNLADTYAFTGTVSGSSFSGDGSALTNLPVSGLGVGQSWSVVSRSINVTYTNSTGKTIAVYIEYNGPFVVNINGLGNEYASQGVTLIIPNGATWRTNGASTVLELS